VLEGLKIFIIYFKDLSRTTDHSKEKLMELTIRNSQIVNTIIR